MFIGPYDQGGDFSEAGMAGMRRFLNRWWGMFTDKVTISEKEDNEKGITGQQWIGGETSPELKSKLQETIAKAGRAYAHFRFNTAIASVMELVNSWRSGNQHLSDSDAKECVMLLAPLAPFMSEELWQRLGGEGSVHQQPFPEADKTAIQEKQMLIVIQVNGKLRGSLEVSGQWTADSEQQITEMAKTDSRVAKWLEGKEVKRVVWVAPVLRQAQDYGGARQGLVNFVVK
jgi:leucyl-tRNA synthetase